MTTFQPPAQPSHAAAPIRSAPRNALLVGYSQVGKTAVAQALAAYVPGASSQQCGQLGMVTLPGEPHPITLLDVSGDPDFVGLRRSALQAVESVIFVISAIHGVDGRTALLWQECGSLGLTCVVLITHLDRPGADFDEASASIAECLGQDLTILALPVHDEPDPRIISVGPAGDRVVGVIDLLTGLIHDQRAPSEPGAVADEETLAAISDHREQLREDILGSCPDQDLVDELLSGEGSPGLWRRALGEAVAAGQLYPVLPIGPKTSVGVPQLIELMTQGFPPPRPAHSVR
ncbi:MAG: GTP-binding protein, partial [Angustibacter sp.]